MEKKNILKILNYPANGNSIDVEKKKIDLILK